MEAVAMYLRKSRAEEGESTEAVLARHKAILTEYAAKHRLPVRKIYEEVVSGDSLFSRPQMMELLHDIDEGQYTGLVCIDIDRLGRGNMQEQGLILNTLKDAGCVIITPEKTYDLNDELDETQTEFKTFFARQELKMIKKRLSRGIQATIKKGGYIANAPYGYTKTMKDKIPTLEPNPEEVKYVRLIFELYNKGEGCQSIAHTLNNMGVKPHRSDAWCRTSVRKIIADPAYIGKIVWNQRHHLRPKAPGEKHRTVYLPPEEWDIVDGIHEPIIDEETFRQANTILKGRYHVPYRESGKIKNPLAGVLHCRQCGASMTLRPYYGRKYQRDQMLCPTKGCVRGSRADYVEEELINRLQEILRDLEIAERAPGRSAEAENEELMLKALDDEKKKLVQQRDKVYELLEQSVYTVDQFKAREPGLTERINAIEAQRAKLQEAAAARKPDQRLPQIRHVLQNYWNGTPSEKNRLLKSVIRQATYYKSKTAAPHDFSIEIELV